MSLVNYFKHHQFPIKLTFFIVFITLPFVGFLVGYSFNRPTKVLSPIESLPPKQNPSQISNDDRANWKTYTNEEYRFEFRYSPELILEENPNSVTVRTSNEVSVQTLRPSTVVVPNFSITVQTKTGSLEDIAKGYLEGDVQMENQTFSWYFDGTEGTGYNYYYLLNENTNQWIEISTYSIVDDLSVLHEDSSDPGFWDKEKRNNTFNQILSTFEFF